MGLEKEENGEMRKTAKTSGSRLRELYLYQMFNPQLTWKVNDDASPFGAAPMIATAGGNPLEFVDGRDALRLPLCRQSCIAAMPFAELATNQNNYPLYVSRLQTC